MEMDYAPVTDPTKHLYPQKHFRTQINLLWPPARLGKVLFPQMEGIQNGSHDVLDSTDCQDHTAIHSTMPRGHYSEANDPLVCYMSWAPSVDHLCSEEQLL